MKQGKSLVTFVILALAAAIALYLGAYVFRALDEPYQTTQVYAYTVNDSVTAEGLVVREALVLSAPAGILEVTRAEGEKVGLGQQIALVYRDSQAQANQAVISELQMEIELLEEAIAQSGDLESAARLDEDILQAVVDLRASYTQGDYTQLQSQVLSVKSSVLKRGYTYGDSLTSTDLATRLSQLKAELAALNRQSAQAVTQVTALKAGVFSNLVDGYESVLTPDSVLQLTPSSLQELILNPVGEDSSAMGKLLTSNQWYFAANLPNAAAERLEEGGSATLRFSGELNRDVEMTVEKIGPAEGELTLVVFSSNRYLTSATTLRDQTAELIFESFSGLRVPKEALRLVETVQTDETTGQETTTHKLGVYALVNGRVELHELSIVYEGADYYVVRPIGTGSSLLRTGDTILIQGTGLQDGMLLEG
ncbi:MAG: hypothetical protein HFF44_02300 [Lawsonibacter sp.]|nr:hypothetical protein [Lawsonibacter sp.]